MSWTYHPKLKERNRMTQSTGFVHIEEGFEVKIGMPVQIREDHSERGAPRGREIAAMKTHVVVYCGSGASYLRTGNIGVGPAVVTGRTPIHDKDYWYYARNDLSIAPMSKAQLKAAIAIETKRLKDAFIANRDADKIAKKAEEDRLAKIEKEKAEKEKALKHLSPAGRRVVTLMNEKPRLLSSYRDIAIEIAEAYTGDKLADLVKK